MDICHLRSRRRRPHLGLQRCAILLVVLLALVLNKTTALPETVATVTTLAPTAAPTASAPLAVDDAALPAYDPNACVVVTACELCTDSDRESIEACSATGRIQRSRCAPLAAKTESSDGEDTAIDSALATSAIPIIFTACQRTADEDEFLLVQFQIACFLLGLGSLYHVRKHKQASASLFDQRKAKARNSDVLGGGGGGGVEMVETQALMTGIEEEV